MNRNNIERVRGDTYAEEFTVFNPNTGAAENIAGATFLMTVSSQRNPTDDTTEVFQLTGVIIDAATGRVGFSPTADQADRTGSYYYDVQMVDSSGAKRTLAAARIRFKQDITKD